jgi:hypothetical protein
LRHHPAALALAVLVLFPIATSAHEGHEHKLMGTVTAVHADRHEVDIKTVKGETVTFTVTSATKYLKGTTAAALAALVPGTRVVAEGKMVENKIIAAAVRIGVAETPAAAPAAKAPAGSHR